MLAEFIGSVVAAEPSIPNAPLHYKDLEISRNKALKNHEESMQLSENNRIDLQW